MGWGNRWSDASRGYVWRTSAAGFDGSADSGTFSYVGCWRVWIVPNHVLLPFTPCACAHGQLVQTAVAVGPTILVTVGRRNFTKLVAKLIQDKTEARLNVLQKNFAFASWSTERLIKLSNFLVPFTFAPNTVIAAESAQIKHVFFVVDGTVRLATSVRANADSTNQVQHQVYDPERHQSRVPHPVHSPRPGRALMDSSVDRATVQVADLGPNSVIGQVELAVGNEQYQGTYIASCVLFSAQTSVL